VLMLFGISSGIDNLIDTQTTFPSSLGILSKWQLLRIKDKHQ
jgi:hypothetical protein